MHEYRPTFPVVNRFQNPSRPAAPPVYRPQPRIAASAGQVSVFAGAHAPQGRGNTAQLQPAGSMRMGNSASARRPAPPVYKPQPMGSAVQPSAAIAPPTSLATQGGRQATAPPVYKPQTQLSAAQSRPGAVRQAAIQPTLRQTHASPPAYRPLSPPAAIPQSSLAGSSYTPVQPFAASAAVPRPGWKPAAAAALPIPAMIQPTGQGAAGFHPERARVMQLSPVIQAARNREKRGGKTKSKRSQRAARQRHAPQEPATVHHLELGAGEGRHVGEVMGMVSHALEDTFNTGHSIKSSYLTTEFDTNRRKFLRTTEAAKRLGVDATKLPGDLTNLTSIVSVNPYGYGPTLKNAIPERNLRSGAVNPDFFDSIFDRLSLNGVLLIYCKSEILTEFVRALSPQTASSLSRRQLRTLSSQFVGPANGTPNPFANLSLTQLLGLVEDYDFEIEVERTRPPATFVGGAPDTNDRDLAPFNVLFRITRRADGKSKGVRFVLDKPRRGKGYHVESSNRIMTDWVKPGGY